MTVDPRLLAAVEALWCLPPPTPSSLMSAPAFAALAEACEAIYGRGKARFALSTALRSLGLPVLLPFDRQSLAIAPRDAAVAIDRAMTQTSTIRRHLCPLDLADDLPALAFGRARLARFEPDELERLFNAPMLLRNAPTRPLQSDRLAQFHWLVVEEEIALDSRPEARTVPAMFKTLGGDLGEVDPHLAAFPEAVEAALFFLLLAPWEDWSTMPEVDWRGFRLPWLYTIDDDLFTWPKPPPDPDSLSLEPWIVQDHWGEDIELERPTTLPLDPKASIGLAHFTDDAWAELKAARATELFETPVVHFLIRAFLADGMDEVMAHMTALEAALGTEDDHRRGKLPKGAPHKTVSATDRVAARIAALLDDPNSIQLYRDLFNLRSAYVHGRASVAKVSTEMRVNARRLTRRVARALVDEANRNSDPRAVALGHLLDRGAPHL